MIDRDILTPVLLEALGGTLTWLDASKKFTVDETIETFFATRDTMHRTVEGLTDAQVAYASPIHPFWSLSETVSHLIYSQNSYHNFLLESTPSITSLPHMIEAARGFGEGARQNLPADTLRADLAEATARIRVAFEATRHNYDPERIINTSLFGPCDYPAWVLLMLGHETDHVRQAIIVRRLARREA